MEWRELRLQIAKALTAKAAEDHDLLTRLVVEGSKSVVDNRFNTAEAKSEAVELGLEKALGLVLTPAVRGRKDGLLSAIFVAIAAKGSIPEALAADLSRVHTMTIPELEELLKALEKGE